MPSFSYETSVDINAPVDVVCDYVADFPRHVEWNHQPQKMTPLTSGPVRVGSQFQTQEQTASNATLGVKVMMAVAGPFLKLMYGAAGYTLAEITALEPNKRVAWKARLPSEKRGDLIRMNWELRIEPNGSGTTVTQHCEIVPPDESPMAARTNDGVVTLNREEATRNLQRLKSILEA